MKYMKKLMAVLLMTAIFVVSGAQEESAKTKTDLVVVLDAGHGGYDTGATGNGLQEKQLTYKIAQYCKAELEKYNGVSVYMTRSNDSFISINRRISEATKAKADVLVSIHINSAPSADAKGAEVYYPNSNYRPFCGSKGQRLASAIQKNLVNLGLRNRGIKTLNSMSGNTYSDGSAADYYGIIRGAKLAGYPGIIVEHAFISNASDAKEHLAGNYALRQLGIADAKGIAACYGLKKTGSATASLEKTEITKLTGKSSSSAYIEWDTVDGANGYEIYRSTSRYSGYKQVAAIKKRNAGAYTDKSVKAGKTYFYKVRPYCMSGNKKMTASFSKAQKVRLIKKPVISIGTLSSSQVKIKWKEVSGAKRYEIYRSTAQDGKYQKIAVVENRLSFKDTKAGKKSYYKVRAAGNGINGNTYSSYSTVKWKGSK